MIINSFIAVLVMVMICVAAGGLMILILILPHLISYWCMDRQRIQRYAKGQCVSCGYDLRHSTSVCPECGRPI